MSEKKKMFRGEVLDHYRKYGRRRVTLDGKDLDPRLDLRNHSPTGLEWGYHGSGPAQLALAMLCAARDDDTALRLYQQFKAEVIANIDCAAPWSMSVAWVQNWAIVRGAGNGIHPQGHHDTPTP